VGILYYDDITYFASGAAAGAAAGAAVSVETTGASAGATGASCFLQPANTTVANKSTNANLFITKIHPLFYFSR
jgi:hypothetical protein